MFIHRRRLARPVVVASHNEMRISYFIPGIVVKYLQTDDLYTFGQRRCLNTALATDTYERGK